MTSSDVAIDLILGTNPSEIRGKVLGLVGYGARGSLRDGSHLSDPEPGAGPCRRVLLGELLATSDFVLPLESETANTLRDERFAVMMKPGAQLVELTLPVA